MISSIVASVGDVYAFALRFFGGTVDLPPSLASVGDVCAFALRFFGGTVDLPPSLSLIAMGMIVCGVLVFVTLVAGVTAPYGRYTVGSHWWCCGTLAARTAWIVQVMRRLLCHNCDVVTCFLRLFWMQEAPSLLIPLAFSYQCPRHRSTASWILLGAFTLHYANRFVRRCVCRDVCRSLSNC